MYKQVFIGIIFALFSSISIATYAADLKIGTWNILHLGWADEKRNWEQTAEIASQFDIVALQEVMNHKAVARLEQTVEKMTGEQWGTVISGEKVGRNKYKELYAFLYKESVIQPTGVAVTYLDREDVFEREPFAAQFKHENQLLTLSTIHLIYGKRKAQRIDEANELDEYVHWLTNWRPEDEPIFLMGDFNLKPSSKGFKMLQKVMTPVLDGNDRINGIKVKTTIGTKPGKYANLYDNIWIAHDEDLVKVNYWVDQFPQRLGISHKVARKTISDHIPVGVTIRHK